jgi:hypothetical protein
LANIIKWKMQDYILIDCQILSNMGFECTQLNMSFHCKL